MGDDVVDENGVIEGLHVAAAKGGRGQVSQRRLLRLTGGIFRQTVKDIGEASFPQIGRVEPVRSVIFRPFAQKIRQAGIGGEFGEREGEDIDSDIFSEEHMIQLFLL